MFILCIFSLQREANSYFINRASRDAIYVHFRLTVPFGCEFHDGRVKDCKLRIELTSPGNLTCAQGLYVLDQCGKTIKQSEWNNKQSIAVKFKNDNSRGVIKLFEIHLLSKAELNGDSFWNGVEVPTIYVSVSASIFSFFHRT